MKNPLIDSDSAFSQMIAETSFAEQADGSGITDAQLERIQAIAPDDELQYMAHIASTHARKGGHVSGLSPSAVTYMRGFAHGVLAADKDAARKQDFPPVHPDPERE